jgi:nicotinate-nucleotide adenylyltransferase
MNKIALFGTSADPPTAGHRAILVWLSQHFDLVAVWASDNPFKSHASPLEHRTKMLGLLIEEIAAPQHNISLYPELSHPRTLVTLERAKEIWADGDFTLAIGSDLVCGSSGDNSGDTEALDRKGLAIMSWYRVEDLLRQVKLLVVPRPGYALSDKDLDDLRGLGTEVAIADFNAPAVSSTAYREKGDTTSLTPPIEAYIHQEHLYECQDAAKSRSSL